MAEAQQVANATQSPDSPAKITSESIVVEDADSAGNGHLSSASDNNQDQSNWVPDALTDIVPPIAMSEIDSDEGHVYAADGTLQSALFVLPFPAPTNAHRSKNTPPFLLYSPPREMYKKPIKREDGKRPKEKILKKLVRIWQQEVDMGEKIKRGELANPTRFKKIRGGCIRVASNINKWLPNSCIETLSRLPPQHKLGTVTLIHPIFEPSDEEIVPQDQDLPYVPTSDELRNDMRVLLRKTRKRILKRAILSGMLLPISLGIDVFAPVFAFEINVTYFAFQIYGLKKAKALNAPPKKTRAKRVKRSKNNADNAPEQASLLVGNAPADLPEGGAPESQVHQQQIFRTKSVPPPALDPVLILMYDICSQMDPVSFPPRLDGESSNSSDTPPSSLASLPSNLKRPGGAVVKDMIEAFKQVLPSEVAERYSLDEERVSEDLARYIKKASKEYIDSLSGRADRKGVVFSVKMWRKKSLVKKEKAALISREKKEAKKQKKEASG